MALSKHSGSETWTLLPLGLSLSSLLCMLCSDRPNPAQGLTLRRSQALWGRLELCGHFHTDADHHTARARMTRPLEGVKALDGGCRGRTHDHTLHEFFLGADLGGDHDLHVAKATQDCVTTEQYLPLPIRCGSCSATEKRRSSGLLLLGAAF